jgi:bacterioferritin-associated ferredoxin
VGPDDKICYCYHVSLRKLWNFVLRRRPQRPSQMSECLGAGTGCGWCLPILKRIFDRAQAHPDAGFTLDLTPEEYAERRKTYIETKQPKNQF